MCACVCLSECLRERVSVCVSVWEEGVSQCEWVMEGGRDGNGGVSEG